MQKVLPGISHKLQKKRLYEDMCALEKHMYIGI